DLAGAQASDEDPLDEGRLVEGGQLLGEGLDDADVDAAGRDELELARAGADEGWRQRGGQDLGRVGLEGEADRLAGARAGAAAGARQQLAVPDVDAVEVADGQHGVAQPAWQGAMAVEGLHRLIRGRVPFRAAR